MRVLAAITPPVRGLLLGLAENPEENVRWLGQWPELPPTLDGPGGDFDEDVSWNNSK